MKRIILLSLVLMSCSKPDVTPSLIGKWKGEKIEVLGPRRELSLGDIIFTQDSLTINNRSYRYTRTSSLISIGDFAYCSYSFINDRLLLKIMLEDIRISQGGTMYLLTYSKT